MNHKEALRGAIKAIKLFIEADRMSSFETSILTDEMRKEIAAYKLAAQEALQSESEQPKSESRMYSEEEVCGFAEWCIENDYKWHWHFDNPNGGSGVLYIDDYENTESITSKELFQKFIQSLQPKTEEVDKDLLNYDLSDQPKEFKDGLVKGITDIVVEQLMRTFYSLGLNDGFSAEVQNGVNGDKFRFYFKKLPLKEQPTSPSIEKMAEERYEDSKWNQGQVDDLRTAFIEGFKANNSLDIAIAHYEKLSEEGSNQAYVVAKYLKTLKP